MPDLPTITLSQEHYDRVVAAMPGDTAAAKSQNYTNLVLNTLIAYIEDKEMDVMELAQDAARQAEVARIQASLPPRLPFPIT